MSQEIRKLIASKIKQYRTEAGYTREQLSLMISRDNSYISKVENLKVNMPVDTLEKIILTLDKNINDFF